MIVSGHRLGGASARRIRIACLAAAAMVPLLPALAPVAYAQAAKSDKPIYKDASQPTAARVEDLLSRMTLEERVAQLISIWEHKDKIQAPNGDFDPAKASAAFPNGLGMISRPSDRRGVTPPAPGSAGAAAGVGNKSAVEQARYVNAAQKWSVEKTRLGIPMFMHEESLHGLVAPGATSFPQSIGLASTWDPKLLEQIFSVAAREARSRGANLVLAPVVDVARDPRWGRIEETYGEDPYLVGEMGLAAIRGFQGSTLPLAKDKVFVTLKHMTGHGQPENGTNVGPASIGERSLRENFFPPFERAVTELPVMSVMASYNELDGVPSHVNHWLLTDVLRGEWGFKGAVVSDYFAIRETVTRHKMFATPKDAGAAAINAGVDVETPDGEAFNSLVDLVREGRVSEETVNNAVRRVLTMKFEGGLFEHPYVDVKAAGKASATPDAIALARQAGREAIVLLRNQGALLPLDATGIHKMAVIGTHANDTPIGGYSDVPGHVVSLLESMQAEGKGKFDVVYSEGVRLTEGHVWAQDSVTLTPAATNDKLRADAVAAAKDADVVVMVLGGNEALSREAWADNHLGDMDNLDLIGPQNQLAQEIIALGKPVVVVLLNGRPPSYPWLAEHAPALLEGWYLGQETGNALADVIFGRFNPGGKLPVSVARDVGQLPIYYNYKPTARRGYLFGDTKPLYPFGYGLSYTTFDVAAPVLATSAIGISDNVKVTVDVTNTGKRAGDEVVQLYVRDDEASVTRPVNELKRFERVTLQPGEKKTVTFELTPRDLSFYNLQMKRVVEPGTFTISSGPDSATLKSTKLTVK